MANCNSEAPDQRKGEKVIASVKDINLYESDIAPLLANDISDEEKNLIVKGYVSNWIKDQLMIIEAEKYMPDDVNVDQLVREYRSSLILNNYENKLVQDLLDTLVSEEQKLNYYNEYKEEFKLSQTIAKLIIVKLDRKLVDAQWIGSVEQADLNALSSKESSYTYSILSPNTWLSESDFVDLLPSKTQISDLKAGKLIRKKDGNHEIFVKVIDLVHKDRVPPLDYIDRKITQIILNNRKQGLLKRKKQQLYDQNYSNNNIKINI